MKLHRFGALAPAFVLAALTLVTAPIAHAAPVPMIDLSPTANGGGFTSALDVGVDPNEATTLVVDKTYIGLGTVVIQFEVNEPFAYTVTEFVRNDTGVDWTGYEYRLFFEADPGVTVGFGDINGIAPFTSSPVFQSDYIVLAGLLPDGDSFTPTLDVDTTGAARITIEQRPLGDVAVPEPATAALGLLACAAIIGGRRRRR